MAKKSPIIIDVRNADEYDKAHAEGSRNIPINELEAHLDEIKNMKEPVIMVCGGGTRNKKAQQLLKDKGIEVEAGGSWKSFS
jgi:rhodanese-related sulfurtransferase